MRALLEWQRVGVGAKLQSKTLSPPATNTNSLILRSRPVVGVSKGEGEWRLTHLHALPLGLTRWSMMRLRQTRRFVS